MGERPLGARLPDGSTSSPGRGKAPAAPGGAAPPDPLLLYLPPLPQLYPEHHRAAAVPAETGGRFVRLERGRPRHCKCVAVVLRAYDSDSAMVPLSMGCPRSQHCAALLPSCCVMHAQPPNQHSLVRQVDNAPCTLLSRASSLLLNPLSFLQFSYDYSGYQNQLLGSTSGLAIDSTQGPLLLLQCLPGCCLPAWCGCAGEVIEAMAV